MKKQINEPDFIGGQGVLTKEEEVALSQYFAKKKENKQSNLASVKSKSRQTINAS